MPKHVLVIEDDPDLIQLVSKLLKSAGYLVTACDDGEQGYIAIQRERPDLIVLDVNLPTMDGFEICERIKADKMTRKIPIVIMTAAYTSAEDAERGLKLGAAEYVIKPFMHVPFLAAVRRILDEGEPESA